MLQKDGLIYLRLANAALMKEIEQLETWKNRSTSATSKDSEPVRTNWSVSQQCETPHITYQETVNTTSLGVQIAIDKESPLSEGLQKAAYPSQFWMGTIPKFRGDSDPRQFLMSYETAIASAGGDEITLANIFACALEGTTLTWYFNLSPKSIYSWENLRDKITSNFRGFKSIEEPLQKLKNIKQ